MQRLLADATKISGIKYDISNLSDVYQAIHIIQEELGITGTTAQEAEQTLSGSFQSMKASFTNFLSGAGGVEEVVSTVLTFMNNLVNAIIKLAPQLVSGVGQLISKLIPQIPVLMKSLIPVVINGSLTIINSILESLPELLKVAMILIQEFAIGLIKALPQLIPSVVETVLTIVDTLLDNIDMIVDTGIEIIFALIDGIIEALPKLIDKIPDIIIKLVEAIIRNLPKIVEAGGKLIIKLVSGIISAIPRLNEAAGRIIKTIWEKLKELPSKVLEIGTNLVKGIWNGISNSLSWIKSKLKGWIGDVLKFIKRVFGIASPSKVMAKEIGQWIPKGISVGIEANTDSVTKAMDDMQEEITNKMKQAVNVETGKMNASATVRSNANYNSIIQVNSVLSADVNMDYEKVGRIVTPVVSKTIRTQGV